MPEMAEVDLSRARLPLLSRSAKFLIGTIFSLGILTAVAALTYAVIRWNFAFSHYGPGVVWHWAAPPLWASLIAIVISILSLIVWSIRRNHQALVGEDGLVLKLGRRRKHYAWQELSDLKLSAVKYGLPFWGWGSHSIALLYTRDGQKLRFRGRIDELDAFTRAIKHHLYPQRLKDYRRALEVKETIVFGPLQCSSDGLTYGKAKYSWDQIRSVSLEGGSMTIALDKVEGKKSLRIPTRKIPNPDLCAQLIMNMEY